MIKKSIGTLADQIRGVSYKKKNLHDTLDKNSVILLRANNIVNGKLDFTDVLYVDKSVVSDTQYLKYGDILISASSGSKKVIGKAASFHSQCKCTFGAFCKVIRPHEDVREFLRIYFQSSAYRRQISHLALGANINNIRNEHIDSLQLGIPNETTRKKIVNKIDLLQKIIIRRQQMLFDLDELIKARFVEMFGNYPTNEKGWKIGIIKDLVTNVRYGTSKKAAENNNGKYPYIRMNNITYDGKLDLHDLKSIDISDKDIEKYAVKKGDMLFNRTNSRDLVGKTCVYDQKKIMVVAGFIIRVRFNELANPLFVSEFLNTDYSKKLLRTICKNASGQSNINAKEMQNIKIYIPPISLQNEFANFVQQVDKSKVAVQKSLEETQTLFDSLMQKYFG